MNNNEDILYRKNRIWEVDFLRGIALILMIIFHIAFDLNEIYNYPINYRRGLFNIIGKVSAILFIVLSGLSCSFTTRNIKRGLKIFIWGMIITVSTYIFDKNMIITFGILHFLGISIMVYPLFSYINKCILLLIGILIIIIGYYLNQINYYNNLLFPIGLTSSSFVSVDYYPMFPWFGVFLIGVTIGKFLYKDKKSLFQFYKRNSIISFLGRNTLVIYIIHQPIILIILYILTKKRL